MELIDKKSKEDLGQILIESGIITNEQLESALEQQSKGSKAF